MNLLAKLAAALVAVGFLQAGAGVGPVGASEPKLTGLGATKTEWAKIYHRYTDDCPSHACYGHPIPGVGANGYQYVGPAYRNGRVVAYLTVLPRHTTIAEALAVVRKQLPSDSKVVRPLYISDFQIRTGEMKLHSDALARVLGSAMGPGSSGQITVDCNHHLPDGNLSYESNDINWFQVFAF